MNQNAGVVKKTKGRRDWTARDFYTDFAGRKETKGTKRVGPESQGNRFQSVHNDDGKTKTAIPWGIGEEKSQKQKRRDTCRKRRSPNSTSSTNNKGTAPDVELADKGDERGRETDQR